MAKGEVLVSKEFSFDAAHQLVGHFGKCANVHGHTYKLQVQCKAKPVLRSGSSDEGFVIDFYHLKTEVDKLIVGRMDHAFLAMGNEPALKEIENSGSKVVRLGFRSTVENMAQYICWRLKQAGLPIYAIRMWETPTGYAEVLAEDIDPIEGPSFRRVGVCDLD